MGFFKSTPRYRAEVAEGRMTEGMPAQTFHKGLIFLYATDTTNGTVRTRPPAENCNQSR